MSRKRTKQYLMLLMVVGLVSIAAGGSGTFASFSAETTNNGNYFATGTLILNDNGGTNTCTSAGDLAGPNTNNAAATNDCDTLFNVDSFTFAQTTLNQASLSSTDGANAVVTVAAISGAAIYKFDTLTISGGGFTESLPVKAYSAAGTTSITVDASGLAHTYTTGATITDDNMTSFANLTLSNAGTIDAKNILFKAGAGCTFSYTEPNTTLNMGTVTLHASSGTTITFNSTGSKLFKTGDTLVVSESGHANSFVVTGTPTATQATVVAAQPWNFAYDGSAVVSGPEFNGGTAHDLCSDLHFSIIETTGAFNQDLSGAAACAYPTVNTNPVAANACDFAASTALGSVPNTFTPLSIATTEGTNTSGQLDAGKSRTFLLAVHYTGASFDNTYQNTEAAAFDLTWHIDQV